MGLSWIGTGTGTNFVFVVYIFICGSFTALSISLLIRDDYDRLQLQEGIFLPSELAERLLHQVQARDCPVSELGKTYVVNRGIFILFFHC